MRVGFNAVVRDTLASMATNLSMAQEVLGERHQLVPFPEDYYDASPSRRRGMAQELIQSCDVIVSTADHTLLGMRSWMNAGVPLCVQVHGQLPRGYFGLEPLVNSLRATDVLVANCSADVAIARTMFRNATVRLLPFAYRDGTFQPPAAEEKAAMRTRLGIPSRAPVVVYAGRCTLEKNIHTVLKVFSVVRAAVPDAHMVLAGPLEDTRFPEFGTHPLNLRWMLDRIIRKLGLAERVHYAELASGDLRALYGTADVMLNLTLHHDENFGLAQVEAMACGTPVVGTRWGGLQDTVPHGEAGWQVSTAVTENGVKSSWWEAANRVVQLLHDPELRARFGERGMQVAKERFSRARHGQVLNDILDEAARGSRRMRELLRISDFTRDLWTACRPNPDLPPPARRNPEARALYGRLIEPYTGTAEGGVAPDAPVEPEQALFLVHPVAWNEDGTLAVNDAQFPCDVRVPAEVADIVRVAVDALAETPVTTVGALMQAVAPHGDPCEALTWMIRAGLVLRTSPALDFVDPALARGVATTPLVSIQRVQQPVDVVYVG